MREIYKSFRDIVISGALTFGFLSTGIDKVRSHIEDEEKNYPIYGEVSPGTPTRYFLDGKEYKHFFPLEIGANEKVVGITQFAEDRVMTYIDVDGDSKPDVGILDYKSLVNTEYGQVERESRLTIPLQKKSGLQTMIERSGPVHPFLLA